MAELKRLKLKNSTYLFSNPKLYFCKQIVGRYVLEKNKAHICRGRVFLSRFSLATTYVRSVEICISQLLELTRTLVSAMPRLRIGHNSTDKILFYPTGQKNFKVSTAAMGKGKDPSAGETIWLCPT